MRLLRTVSLLIVLVLLAACSSGSSGSDAGWSGADSAGAEHGPEIDQAADGAAEDADESAAGPREVITTGSLTLVVADSGAAVTQIVALVESDGGRVEGRSEYTTTDERDASAWLTVRVRPMTCRRPSTGSRNSARRRRSTCPRTTSLFAAATSTPASPPWRPRPNGSSASWPRRTRARRSSTPRRRSAAGRPSSSPCAPSAPTSEIGRASCRERGSRGGDAGAVGT